MARFKVGEKVSLINCGASYSSLDYNEIQEFIKRYKPINASITNNTRSQVNIKSWYGEADCLDKRNLSWRVRFIMRHENFGNDIYFITSNKNHFLVISERGLGKFI